MDLEQAKAKVEKLMRLSGSGNLNEAASAMAHAQRIMERYAITEAMIEEEEDEEEICDSKSGGFDPLESFGANQTNWKSRLGMVISEANGCVVYLNKGYDVASARRKTYLQIIGRESDVQRVRFLYSHLRKGVDWLAAKHGKGKGKNWNTQFRMGVVDTVEKKIKEEKAQLREEMREERADNPQALIRLNQTLVQMDENMEAVRKWADDKYNFRRGASYRYRMNPDARRAGRIAGQDLNVNPRKSLNSG